MRCSICRVTNTSSNSFLRETLWLTAKQTWWRGCVFLLCFTSLWVWWRCWRIVISYPHRPLTETQRQGLDWVSDGAFVNCTKWRQKASSCPPQPRMGLLSGLYLTRAFNGSFSSVLSELQRSRDFFLQWFIISIQPKHDRVRMHLLLQLHFTQLQVILEILFFKRFMKPKWV